MKEKTKPFEQFLHHEYFEEEDSQKYLDKSLPIIGEIIMQFNGLENDLDSIICEIINDRTDAVGFIILHKMNYHSKVDLFKRFNEDFFQTTEIEISDHSKLIERLRKCGSLRNLVVHADWENTDIAGYTYVKLRINQKEGMSQEYIQFSENSLLDINQLIRTTRSRLESFWEDRNNSLNQIK